MFLFWVDCAVLHMIDWHLIFFRSQTICSLGMFPSYSQSMSGWGFESPLKCITFRFHAPILRGESQDPMGWCYLVAKNNSRCNMYCLNPNTQCDWSIIAYKNLVVWQVIGSISKHHILLSVCWYICWLF